MKTSKSFILAVVAIFMAMQNLYAIDFISPLATVSSALITSQRTALSVPTRPTTIGTGYGSTYSTSSDYSTGLRPTTSIGTNTLSQNTINTSALYDSDSAQESMQDYLNYMKEQRKLDEKILKTQLWTGCGAVLLAGGSMALGAWNSHKDKIKQIQLLDAEIDLEILKLERGIQ